MYSRIARALADERESQGLTQPAVAKRMGKKKQHLWNWENEKARPSLEDMASWAGALGYRLVIDVVPAAAPPVPGEVTGALASLTPDEQQAVLRFARVLARAHGLTRRVLLRYVDDIDAELAADERAASAG